MKSDSQPVKEPDAETYVKLAKENIRKREYKLALDQSEKALSIDKSLVSAHVIRTQILILLSEITLAEKAQAVASSVDPESKEVQNLTGSLLIRKGMLSEAELFLKRSLRQHPGFWKLHYNLAFIYYQEKRFLEASSHFWSSFKHYPDLMSLSGLIVTLYFAYPMFANIALLVSLIFPFYNRSPLSLLVTPVIVGYFFSAGVLQINSGSTTRGYAVFGGGLLILALHILAITT